MNFLALFNQLCEFLFKRQPVDASGSKPPSLKTGAKAICDLKSLQFIGFYPLGNCGFCVTNRSVFLLTATEQGHHYQEIVPDQMIHSTYGLFAHRNLYHQMRRDRFRDQPIGVIPSLPSALYNSDLFSHCTDLIDRIEVSEDAQNRTAATQDLLGVIRILTASHTENDLLQEEMQVTEGEGQHPHLKKFTLSRPEKLTVMVDTSLHPLPERDTEDWHRFVQSLWAAEPDAEIFSAQPGYPVWAIAQSNRQQLQSP